VINDLLDNAIPILLDFVEPFVNSQGDRFIHWHYLIEPDICRGQNYCEIRLRFEGERTNLNTIRHELTDGLRDYSDETNIAMREEENLGSHEGCHGRRDELYLGPGVESFGRDWDTIIEIMQVGSESALKILRLGRKLEEERSLRLGGRERTIHPYYLHLPANQLFVEP
jgi:hypothetical protein